MNKTTGLIIAGAVIIGALAFFCGLKFGQRNDSGKMRASQFQNLTAEQHQQFQQNGGLRRSGQGNGFIAGEILSKDDKSIIIKLPDGGSKIIFYSASTTVAKTAEGTLADLAVGTNISANGSANSDGSLTAQSIQIRPQIQPPAQPAPAEAASS